MGKAVVTASIGARGIVVTHGGHLFIADSPAAFADCVQVLLEDEVKKENRTSRA